MVQSGLKVDEQADVALAGDAGILSKMFDFVEFFGHNAGLGRVI